MLESIFCGWGTYVGALGNAEKSHPGIILWLLLSALGAGVVAAIVFGIAYMFSDAGKEKENAKSAGGIAFVVLMIISIIVYIS